MPLEPNQELLSNDILNTMSLIPENRAYWTYMGSLTTPPCTENVLWMVMKQPQQISPEQIAIFARLYKNNARPVQPVNNRLVKESR
jgi:carbonic anhydrase